MNLTTQAIDDALIAGAKLHFDECQAAVRKSCKHALLAGLNLAALHIRTENHGARNDLTSGHVSGSRRGFEAACKEIGIHDRTARRWMNACAGALVKATVLFTPGEMLAELPDPGTPKWEEWERALCQVSEGMSLKRLMLGQVKDGTEDYRYDRLISDAEAGSTAAEEVLQKIADGKMSLEEAIRAATGALATKEKNRNDPVYLGYDIAKKTPVGLIPKALVTLENGFSKWEEYDADARAALRKKWLKAAPLELTELLRR